MWIPDLLLLVAIVALTVWRTLAREWRPRLRIVAVALGVIVAVAQWVLCSFTWQLLPAYPLLALSALPRVRLSGAARTIGRFGVVGMVAVSIGVWILPAVPRLPHPDGPYAIGTDISRWTDAARDEPHTADRSDRRSVIVQTWYPTTRRHDAGGARLPYIDGIGNMPRQVAGVPSFLLHRYGHVDSHAAASAPLAHRDRPWPVVIFSPGYGAPRAIYTGLATQLASRGFVVVVLDHPFESGVTQLPNGQVVGTQERFPPGRPDRIQYMVDQQVVRTADIRFVIDQLARSGARVLPLQGGQIDASKVAVIGHSFGGAVSAMAMSEDERVVAAVNIDGTPYGDLPDRQLTRPFMLLQSDLTESPHGDWFYRGNDKLLTTMTAPGFRYELQRANHFSFTDAPFFVAPWGRWLVAKVMGGSRGPAATQQATADLVVAFLSGPLTGANADVAAVAARYPHVLGGPVNVNSSASVVR